MAKANKANEIRLVRVYDAPLSAVWDAWTDPQQVAVWWGPRGFTLTTHSKDLRDGGHWSYTMHGPDGVDYPNTTVYLVVEPYKKLVYDHGGHQDRPPMFRMTVLFSEENEKTTLDLTMSLKSPEHAAEVSEFIKKARGNSTWDRLAEYLEKHQSGTELFVINRSFDAPLERVFQMWTQPEHVVKWLPPTGFNMEFLRADIREGGDAFFTMYHEGERFYGRHDYVKVEAPSTLVYVLRFCDAQEQTIRPVMAPTWPEALLMTLRLADEGAGQTRVTLAAQPHGACTAAELAAFVQERGGMTEGWTGSFDKLERLLD